MSEVSGVVQSSSPTSCDPAPCRQLAGREFAAWFDDPRRCAIARRKHGDRAALERLLSIRLEGVLAHDRPASANRRWLCEAIRGWAPLEVIFPSRDYSGLAGVSGELPRHAALLVERAYGHVLAATRNVNAACDLLRADTQLLELQIAVATSLQPLLQVTAGTALSAGPLPTAVAECGVGGSAPPGDWPNELREMSLAMAEFLHRHSIGLSPVLADPVVMSYTAQISRLRRSVEAECRRARAAA